MPIYLIAAAACVLLMARCAAHQKHPLRAILASALCGVGGFGAVALLAPYTGVELPLNQFTGFVAAVLGLPGVISLLLLQIIL